MYQANFHAGTVLLCQGDFVVNGGLQTDDKDDYARFKA